MSSSPESSAVVDFTADSLVLPQAAEEADLSGENFVVGNLKYQLLTWKQKNKSFQRALSF